MSIATEVPPDTLRAVMRALSQRAAAPVPRVCAVCGETFQGRRTARYCGNTCKVRARRAKARASVLR